MKAQIKTEIEVTFTKDEAMQVRNAIMAIHDFMDTDAQRWAQFDQNGQLQSLWETLGQVER